MFSMDFLLVKKRRKENSGGVMLRRAHLKPLVLEKFGVTDAFLTNEEESKVRCAVGGGPRAFSKSSRTHL